ncbi:hypothetical protein FS749_001225 [Ceratobasidium sp. UAMH 11750]|nr:hypothetical protein FS749_001225 [Ceratobasidium sp. UAMH 11750]
MRKPPFVFKPFTGDVTPHGQLQEWAEHYGVTLKWSDTKIQPKGITQWTSYPIIQGHHYIEFTGSGPSTRDSHKQAAKMIIESDGTLDEARRRIVPVIARM